MFKDSFNSATRYYQNRFKDAYRQAAIDVMLGEMMMADVDLLSPEGEDPDLAASLIEDTEHHERVKQVIEDCKKILIPEAEIILGGWPMIDADPATGHQNQEMDTVLILTADNYYVAEYDDQTDRISRYQKVSLEDLEKIECGPEPGSLFSHRNLRIGGLEKNRAKFCIRLFYVVNGQSGYFHMFKPTETRFFNNMTIPIRTAEEEIESLKAICESFKVALSVKSINVPFFEGKLEKKKSRTVNFFSDTNLNTGSSRSRIERITSDGNLMSLKSAGSKALMGVSSQLSKFKGKLSKTVIPKPSSSAAPSSDRVFFESSSSSDRNATQSCGSNPDNNTDASDDDSVSLQMHPRSSSCFYDSVPTVNSVFVTERESDYESGDEDISSYDAVPELMIGNADLEPQSLPPTVTSSSGITFVAEPSSDALLESCGIITTGCQKAETSALEGNLSSRGVFKDVDDFVMDSIKKASLRNLYKRASEGAAETGHSSSSSSSRPQIRISSMYEGGEDQSTRSLENIDRREQQSYHHSDHASSGGGSGGLIMGVGSSYPKETTASCAALVPFSGELMMNISDNHLAGGKKYSIPSSSTSSAVVESGGGGGGLDCNSLNVSASGQMKNSHSEAEMMALNLMNVVSSHAPVMLKKDLVLSPLSRIAKGVQNISSNILTTRQAGGSSSTGVSPSGSGSSSPTRKSTAAASSKNRSDSYEKIKIQKRSCKTRIIEL